MASMLDWANYYHFKMGWNVLPTYPRQKRVAIEWEEYQRRRTDPKHFEEWFGKRGYNVALMLGPTSGISVLDIDSKEGWFALQEMLEGLDAPIVKTPGGEYRRHYYFQHDPNMGNIPSSATSGKWEYRSTNCIIVAPPSSSVNGGKYAWVVKPILNQLVKSCIGT